MIRHTAIALALLASPALADDGLPPAKYDVGGNTEFEVLQNIYDIWGTATPPTIAVPYGEALTVCDRIQMTRYGMHYPAAETAGGATMEGCLIRNSDLSDPVIVYSVSPYDQGMAATLLRHEVGHLLGWPGTHQR